MTYRATIADVEAALARAQHKPEEGSGGVIVSYNPARAGVRPRILAETNRSGLIVTYDLPRMNAIAIGGVPIRELQQATRRFRSIKGVLEAHREQTSSFHRPR